MDKSCTNKILASQYECLEQQSAEHNNCPYEKPNYSKCSCSKPINSDQPSQISSLCTSLQKVRHKCNLDKEAVHSEKVPCDCVQSSCQSLSKTCVTVRQPPKLVMKKDIVYVKKSVQEPRLTNVIKKECMPRVTYVDKLVREPKLIWETQIRQIPQVCWKTAKVNEPHVVNCPRTVCEKKEICRPVVYQPQPQRIPIPPPKEFCCYKTGPETFKNNKPKYAEDQCPPCPREKCEKACFLYKSPRHC